MVYVKIKNKKNLVNCCIVAPSLQLAEEEFAAQWEKRFGLPVPEHWVAEQRAATAEEVTTVETTKVGEYPSWRPG